MRIIETTIYEYGELSPAAQEKARNWFLECSTQEDWWNCTYEDAEQAGLKLSGFDMDSASFVRNVEGAFIISAVECANLILANHGKDCDTFKAAQAFEAALDALPELPAESAADYGEYARRLCESVDALEGDFLEAVLLCYRDLLQSQYEYICSEAAIVEAIESMAYEFTENGARA